MKYYITAMMFIIFDIEVVFLLPWAVAYRQLPMFAVVAMIVFIVAVFIPTSMSCAATASTGNDRIEKWVSKTSSPAASS